MWTFALDYFHKMLNVFEVVDKYDVIQRNNLKKRSLFMKITYRKKGIDANNLQKKKVIWPFWLINR